MAQINPSMLADFPSDILQTIFLDTCRPASYMSPNSPEILLSHVCRSWRDLLLSTSSFWSVLFLGFKWTRRSEAPLRLKQLHTQRRMIDTWVKRSKDYPLFVALMFKDYVEEGEVEATVALMDVAISVSGRWESLVVQCYPQIMKHIVPLVPSKTPLLTSFDIRATPKRDVLEGDLELTTLSLVPFPESVHNIHVGGLSMRLPSFAGTWSGLTHFEYSPQAHNSLHLRLSLDDIHGLIACCPALTAVMTCVQVLKGSPSSIGGRLTVPSLKILVLASIDDVDFGPLLDDLDAVNLEYLSFDGELRDGWDTWCHVSDFVLRSRPPLETLALHGTPITSESLVQCLLLLPGLRDLELDGCVFDDFLVSMLTWRPCVASDTMDLEGNILPHLQKLLIRDCVLDSRLEQARFTHMLHSRLVHLDIGSMGDEESALATKWRQPGGVPSGVLNNVWLTHRPGTGPMEILFAEQGKQLLITNPIIRPYRKKGVLYFRGDYVDAYFERGLQRQFEES